MFEKICIKNYLKKLTEKHRKSVSINEDSQREIKRLGLIIKKLQDGRNTENSQLDLVSYM